MNLWNCDLDEESVTAIVGAFGAYAVSHFDTDFVACGNQSSDGHLSKTNTLDLNGSVLQRDELIACRQKPQTVLVLTFSLSVSRAEVASSRSSICGFRTRALAMAILCFCPPEMRVPLSPTRVS